MWRCARCNRECASTSSRVARSRKRWSKRCLKRAPFVRDVEVVHLLTLGCADYVAPEMAGHFRHNAFFIGGNVRAAVNDGRADYTPVYLSEVEELFESGAMPLDVALIEVSPPDTHGFCCFGVGVDTTLTAARCARHVIAQVNDQMPRTFGDSFIHVSQIHAFVDSSRPLCQLPKQEISELHVAIARNVAGLIDDGAVIQTGIGGIPDAVLPFLMDRKDLGVHSELVSDSVIPLIEAGVLNGARKNFKPRKIILGFALGTKKLFDFVDNNPIFEFHPSAYSNDPALIARNDNMVAINSALQVDLTGQVCSDSIGTNFYSGIGGQVDFLRGAAHSKGGKPIIALPSTARNGEDSPHRADAHRRIGRSDQPRAGALHRHRIRRGQSARQDDPGASQGAHRDLPPEIPGRAV